MRFSRPVFKSVETFSTMIPIPLTSPIIFIMTAVAMMPVAGMVEAVVHAAMIIAPAGGSAWMSFSVLPVFFIVMVARCSFFIMRLIVSGRDRCRHGEEHD